MNGAPWLDIASKALLAVVFFFFLQYAILRAPLETSLLWGVGMGVLAAVLAWSQWKRG